MVNNWLHLQEPDKPVKCFKTWRACSNYIFENNISDYFIAEENIGIIVKAYSENDKRRIVLDPEHLPPASVIPFL